MYRRQRAGTGRRIGDRHSFIFIELGGKKARQHAHRDMPFPGPGLICGRHTPNDGNTRFLIWPLMQPPVPRRPLDCPAAAPSAPSQPARTTNRPRPEHTTLGFSHSRSLILTYHHTSLVHICKLTSSETNASRQQLHSPPFYVSWQLFSPFRRACPHYRRRVARRHASAVCRLATGRPTGEPTRRPAPLPGYG